MRNLRFWNSNPKRGRVDLDDLRSIHRRPAAVPLVLLAGAAGRRIVPPNLERWERRLTILAVEKVAHRLSPRCVRFRHGLAFVGIHALRRY